MRRISLISDTHGWLDPALEPHLSGCDEIWHAGDIGSLEVAEKLEAVRPLRAVHGNVDGPELRWKYPEELRFHCEGIDTWMIHIGGYPGRYPRGIREVLEDKPPALFICGHSHILRVMPDRKHRLLHINPGACGRQGLHLVKTLITFVLEAGKIGELDVVELGPR
ncbi:MAG: metallophosphoesterase family protein [Armatimonadetes bacterium]|nr:metallophosphoesterase family protein [Armatimonadota bacterium]